MKLIVLSLILATIVNAEVGCSDYDCECHPDSKCNPPFSKYNPCHGTPRDCYGPVIVTVFTIEVNASVAQSFLPDGLEPSPNPVGLYPVTLMFNQQHNVATWNYLEFILSLSVQWNDKQAPNYKYRGPFGYGAKLYLDEIGPTVAGQAYGVNKETTNITQSCDNNGNCVYTVYASGTKTGEKLMEATWAVAAAPNDKYINGTSVSNFEKYQVPALSMPMVAEYPVNVGVFQCGVCDWFLDYALIQPVTGSLTIYKSFFGDIPPGTYKFGRTIEQSPLGAYRMETMWMFEDNASPTKETCTNFEPPRL